MTLSIWTKRSGYRFPTIQERTVVDQILPVTYENNFDDSSNVNFSVISGKLPPGLRIVDDKIVGTAFEVPRSTDFEFVVRADYGDRLDDRTFFLKIEGPDEPRWVTPPGTLPVGANNRYYILENSYIDFRLVATDFDTAAGQKLEFFMGRDSGQLPPGLRLTDDGRIVGWIQPLLEIPVSLRNGAYDMTFYDQVAYDFGRRSTNGYDSFVYDSLNYDFALPEVYPKKLNRYYEFIVSVTDGDTVTSRKFKIYVVGDDYFRSDNTIMRSGDGTFRADITYVRVPIWTTPAYLGRRRANNYQTFKLDVYEEPEFPRLTYNVNLQVTPGIPCKAYKTNANENTAGKKKIHIVECAGKLRVGQGLSLENTLESADKTIYEITQVQEINPTEFVVTVYPNLTIGIPDNIELSFGKIESITKSVTQVPISYSFDLVNPDILGTTFTTLLTENKIGTNLIRIKSATGTPADGDKIWLYNYVKNADNRIYTVTNVDDISSTEFILTLDTPLTVTIDNDTKIPVGSLSVLPPGMQFDQGSGEVVGVVPYQPATTQRYNFTVLATRFSDHEEIARSRRTFSVDIIGEIDSVISWITDGDLGSINANYISELSVKAVTTGTNSLVLYFLQSGQLPPGLTLNLDGEIIGKVTQFGAVDNPGLITIDNGDFTMDFGETTLDRIYTFTIEAKDIINLAAVSKTFSLRINTPNDRLYSNLYVRPFLKQDQRALFRDFITDDTVFDRKAIYRPYDKNFGIQRDLKMLIFAGIETKTAGEVAGIIEFNHSLKRFRFGGVKKAQAKIPGTNTVVYEVIYVEILDPLEPRGLSLPLTVTTQPNKTVRYPSSVTLWRKRISDLGLKDRNYLPLWMRSIQDGQVEELDYIKAVPLCFCNPGYGDDILLNVKNRKFDFSQLDYVVDRYTIDSVTGYTADKYIMFKNDGTILL